MSSGLGVTYCLKWSSLSISGSCSPVREELSRRSTGSIWGGANSVLSVCCGEELSRKAHYLLINLCSYAHLCLKGKKFSHSAETQSRVAAPLHQEKPVEAVWGSG